MFLNKPIQVLRLFSNSSILGLQRNYSKYTPILLNNLNRDFCCNQNKNPKYELSNQLSFGAGFLQNRFLSQNINETKSPNNVEHQAALNDLVVENSDDEIDILYKSIQIEARSADRAVLDSYEKFVTMSANYLDIELARIWEPFRTIKRRTLLRAAFVKKKYRVQYEWRTYYRNMQFKHLTGSTADTFLEYIERNLPEGVALKVTRERIETIPSHLIKPPQQQ